MLLSALLIAMPASTRHSAAFSSGFRHCRRDADARNSSAMRFPRQFEVIKSISCGFHLNASYVFAQSSTPNASPSPAIPGSNRSIFSVGPGQYVDSMSLAIARPCIRARSGAVSLGAPADGTPAFDSNATTFSLGNHF
jgi:hypothetical protein